MKRLIVTVLAIVIAVLIIGSISVGTAGQMRNIVSNEDNAIGVNDVKENSDNNDNDNDRSHCNASTAGGGGWFMINGFKNTFGFCLNDSDLENSSFVFQARSSMMTVHSLNFTKIVFEDDDGDGNWTAHAYGNATVKKLGNFSFHLQVTDCGKGDTDKIDLWLTSDNESYHWGTDGLGGGNIWIKRCQ
ncbi:MAG: hypothetical protein QXE45_01035 [Thermoplasmata archaeon]